MSNGGGQYASRADQATKAEQIAVAERLLDDRGWGPWPACSRKLGLDRADAKGSPSGTATASRSKARKVTTKAKPVSTNRASGKVYTVRRGDTLSGIANRKNVPGGWHRLYKINKRTIGSNPGLIHPGQRLVLR